jgi:hypothetical protein
MLGKVNSNAAFFGEGDSMGNILDIEVLSQVEYFHFMVEEQSMGLKLGEGEVKKVWHEAPGVFVEACAKHDVA